jgi:serine protease AprX
MARTWTEAAPTSTRPARWAVALVVTAATVAAGTTGPARADAPVTPGTDKGSLAHVAEVVGALDAYRAGYTGKGVGVALIDTGVAPVAGLTSGNVLDGPDLSFDAATGAPRGIDAYGHGTHMAGIIAGRDAADTPPDTPPAVGGTASPPTRRCTTSRSARTTAPWTCRRSSARSTGSWSTATTLR